ncbi:MAG TPA: glycosyltransferase [Pirellulales bacterium]
MRVSVIIASHNEGANLLRTVASSVDVCAGLDYEIIVADDASWDDSVAQAQSQFPQLRLVSHAERRGASPTKALGAAAARGEVMVFLDGHTKPESGSIPRLVEDVERAKGQAIVTPRIPALNARRWQNDHEQSGNGYYVDLATLSCGWRELERMRKARLGPATLYESPALIGCALAVHRELYAKLWGFDRHMRLWGVEDLDFGLKCWLMGHSILHDPEAVVGHRFRAAFDNYTAPLENLMANQLRLAYKNFAPGVWADWLDRCRRRHPERLVDHPEGLWAHVWKIFDTDRPSADRERSYLQSQRARDEFWYADRFGLPWPRLEAEGVRRPAVKLFEAEPSPSPPPKQCTISRIQTAPTGPLAVGQQVNLTAAGTIVGTVTWSSDGAAFDSTEGVSVNASWDTPGDKQVTASCGNSTKTITVRVLRVTLSPSPLRTGFVSGSSGTQIKKTITATVEPAAAASSVNLTKAGNTDEIRLSNRQVDTAAGTVTMDVIGAKATPPSKPNGDVSIVARAGGKKFAEASVIVLVPKSIQKPAPPLPGGPVPAQNVRATNSSTPPWPVALPANQAVLATTYTQTVSLQVLDQFTSPLDNIYSGAMVEEQWPATKQWTNINQPLDGSGKYNDAVFAFMLRNGGHTVADGPASTYLVSSDEYKTWLEAPTVPLENFTQASNYPVRVAGHVLNPGLQGRRFEAQNPDIINVLW